MWVKTASALTSVTGLVAGGQAATGTGIGTTYLVFDFVVALILIVQGWLLLWLLRRHSRLELPLCGPLHALDQSRRWILPLLWEIGIPVAIIVGVPQVAGASWGVMLLFTPDLSFSLIIITGLFLLMALVRLVKAGLSLRAQPTPPSPRATAAKISHEPISLSPKHAARSGNPAPLSTALHRSGE